MTFMVSQYGKYVSEHMHEFCANSRVLLWPEVAERWFLLCGAVPFSHQTVGSVESKTPDAGYERPPPGL